MGCRAIILRRCLPYLLLTGVALASAWVPQPQGRFAFRGRQCALDHGHRFGHTKIVELTWIDGPYVVHGPAGGGGVSP